MTRFDEILPHWQVIKNLWQFIYGLFGFGAEFSIHLGTICMLLSRFSLLKMANLVTLKVAKNVLDLFVYYN